MTNNEKFPNKTESRAESNETALDRFKDLDNKYEKSIELSSEELSNQTERARNEALEIATSIERGSKEAEKEQKPTTAPRHGTITKKQKNDSYKRTIKRVQSELPTRDKVFSKIIHNDVVEKTSEIVGNTVARPNSILAGAICAFILTLATYYIAKNIGYRLSGSETIISFCIGWIIGLLYDYLKTLIFGKK